MDPLNWSVVFTVLMLGMVAVELLTPAMGGFVLAALVCAGVSVFSGFQHSPAAGWLMLALNGALFPLALFLGFHFLKRSPLVNRVQGQASESNALAQLKGEVGKTMTPLRPAGAALINGSKVDVLTDGKFVEPGRVVRVIRVHGASVFVEPESEA